MTAQSNGSSNATRPRYPLPRYPTGWFQLAWCNELEPGQVRPIQAFGKELVLFRTESGAARLLDAHCPHMGAHLGHGGKVAGESVVCPFHAWKFDGETGACTEIPYATKVPKKAKAGCWPVQEINGLIMTWFDKGGRDPMWDVPELPEFNSDEWTEPVHRQWRIRTHNQEMAENMVDTAHFRYLHGTINMPGAEVEANGPVLSMRANTVMTTPGGQVDGRLEATAYGFGFSINRFFGIVDTALIGAVVPADDDYCDVRFTFAIKKLGGRSINRGVGKAFVAEISKQLEEDKPIWENKVYIDPPLLCDGDGPVGMFRRWCRQFYPEAYRQEAYEAYHGRPMPHSSK